ncbi:hypothetical protein [Amycolatopsis thermoflava]|uniref:hypothetical protein n=1 Tax=Amycolatopsis thermoflava TaxID=84480 RepID=UPI0003FE5FE6|nr:hypothetical protein [Amycolatopsis thermoflava]
MTKETTMTEQHTILRRWKNPRSTGVVHRAECSCGEYFGGPDAAGRDRQVNQHLALYVPEVGQVFMWNGNTRCTVTKVGRKYAYLRCQAIDRLSGTWEKKQPMPLAPSFVLVEEA